MSVKLISDSACDISQSGVEIAVAFFAGRQENCLTTR